eukprot:GGOE01001476.1.p1 GENE.GGOE01001476.1~~GGOE01001476.1.p1  ORF type:complete len:618 (-),score=202.87 GGOE01001476.1:635-2413(-)
MAGGQCGLCLQPCPSLATSLILLLLLCLPGSAGMSLSIWLDTWFIREQLEVISGGSFQLFLNVSTDNYHLLYRDSSRTLVVDHIPAPPDDYILHLGIVMGNGPSRASDISLYAGMKRCLAKQRSTGTVGAPPAIQEACSHLGRPIHPSFHRKVTVVCEVKGDALDEHSLRAWAQHQRDNTIGLEQRLFVVDGNGRDVVQKGRHATLSYSFTVQAWFVFKGCEEGQPLFWQGTFVLAMLYCQEGNHHFYKVFTSDSMDIWTSETLANPTGPDRMQLGVSRDILKGWVHLFENGHLLKAQRDANNADTILQSFDIVTEDLRRDLVFSISASDQPTSASDFWDLYRRAKPKMMAMPIANSAEASSAGGTLGEEAAAEEGNDSEEDPGAAAQEKGNAPAASPFPVNIYSQRKEVATLQVPGGPYTLELAVCVRHADPQKALLLLDGRHMRLWLRYRSGICTYMLAHNRQKWISNGAPASQDDFVHVGVVGSPALQRPRLYHQNVELRLSPPDRSAAAWTTDSNAPGPVAWYDLFHSALSLADFHRLALRRPQPNEEDVYWGLVWLLGFLVFGMGCGGLVVVVAFDVGKGAKAEKIV